MLFAVLVPYAHTFAFDNDARLTRFKGFVLQQMVPHVDTVSFYNMRDIIVAMSTVHFRNPYPQRTHPVRFNLHSKQEPKSQGLE